MRHTGLWAVIATCVIWGLSLLYYGAIEGVPAVTILAHRTLWSLVFFVVLLAVQARLRDLRAALASPRLRARIAVAAVLISVNWFLFIWAIQASHVVETSLGYYIMPLVSVLLGVLVLGERLAAAQWLAVGLAGAAVVVLTLGLGVAPWIALGIAGSFGCYGLAKKRLPLAPVLSVAAEVALLAPLALGWLILAGPGAGFGGDAVQTGLLIGAGLVTSVPLVLFAYGAQRVGLASLGITSYLNPTLQFLVATLVLAEPFTRWHLVAFALIWAALAIYGAQLMRHARHQRALVPGARPAIRGEDAIRGRND